MHSILKIRAWAFEEVFTQSRHISKLFQILIVLFSILAQTIMACSSKKIALGVTPEPTVVVPLGGNTWSSSEGAGGAVDTAGIVNWTNAAVSFTTYVRFSKTGTLKLWLNAGATTGSSTLQVTIANTSKKVAVNHEAVQAIYAGTWTITDTGYVALKISGVAKTGVRFADVNSIRLQGTAVDANTAFVKNNEGDFFYWGRRGPSVHLNYELPQTINAEWFYNEVTVPQGNDVIGSYFMADGFAEGYFGMQVNSATERCILFSVWSPFQTDDPTAIPDDQKIVLLKKGNEVNTGEFGNEGSGGQSYLRYNWKAGVTYKFLLHAVPANDSTTVYTAYFFTPEQNVWLLIASFRRPHTQTYLKHLHSFLENFEPETGEKERRVQFGNQRVLDATGQWKELTRARFTGDNTAIKGFRKDYGGGMQNGAFYLRNCGFFSDYTPLFSWYERPPTGTPPAVEFALLP